MLTPGQIRLRLDAAMTALDAAEETSGVVAAAQDIVSLLYDVLPELVTLASGRSDAGAQRYGGGVPGRMWQERG